MASERTLRRLPLRIASNVDTPHPDRKSASSNSGPECTFTLHRICATSLHHRESSILSLPSVSATRHTVHTVYTSIPHIHMYRHILAVERK